MLPVINCCTSRYKYRYTNAKGDEVVKEVLLNELDPIFPQLRHLHIAEAIDSVLDLFNKFLQVSLSLSLSLSLYI